MLYVMMGCVYLEVNVMCYDFVGVVIVIMFCSLKMLGMV